MKYICEIFDDIIKADTEEKKLAILKLANRQAPIIKAILKDAYDPAIEFYVNSENTPEWRPDTMKVGLSPSNLITEYRRIYLFKSDQEVKLKNSWERLLINMLESMHPKEAFIILGVFNSEVKAISAELALKAFPGLFPESNEKTKEPVLQELVDDPKFEEVMEETAKEVEAEETTIDAKALVESGAITAEKDSEPIELPELTEEYCDENADDLEALAKMNDINPDDIETWQEVAKELMDIASICLQDANEGQAQLANILEQMKEQK